MEPGSTRRRLSCVRTKTGCLTCRERRKKCNEAKPVCSGCARNFIECKWPALLVLNSGTKARKSSQKDSLNSGFFEEKTPGQKDSPQSTPTSVKAGAVSIQDLSPSLDKRYAKVKTDTHVVLEKRHGEIDDPKSVIAWQPLVSSFISPHRAILLTNSSLALLQHYMESTSTWLVAKPIASNPFIAIALPLAASDDLLMHALLALSGTHLTFRKGGDLKIQAATSTHYSLLLRSLRTTFADETLRDDVRKMSRLLLVLVVLCHIEAISGEPHGGIFPHLRASRELVLRLLQEPKKAFQDNVSFHDDVELVKGFALEVYCYLILVNSITPYGRDEARTIPFDTALTSLEFLKEYETFGVFFGCGQNLFELIPKVSVLAATRLVEEESGESTQESRTTYEALLDTLEKWQSPPVAYEMARWEAEHIKIGEIYRHSLLAFLKVSMCGSVVNNPKVLVAVQRHIDIAMPLMDRVADTPFVTILLWPIMILGSCLICEHQRKHLAHQLLFETRIDISQVVEASKLLEMLWNEEDERAYGPYGLYLVMRKYHINFSMA